MIIAIAHSLSFTISYYTVYHSLIFMALSLSVLSYYRGRKKAIFLMWVLLATFIVEGAVALFKYYAIKGQTWVYHVFNLFEYSFFCLYYYHNCCVKRYKPYVLWSIPVFVIFGIFISAFVYHFKSMPAININVEGLLLFVIYTQLLFSIDIDVRMLVYSHPDFWIATGVLTFFGGVFVYFNLYRTLLKLDYRGTMIMFGQITEPLNIIFYTCIIIGLICLNRNQKYLAL